MKEAFIIIGVVLLVLLFVVFAIYYLTTSAMKINNELNSVKNEANDANTIDEIEAAFDHLKEVNKKCWHKEFGQKIILIKDILQTKYKSLSEEKYVYVTYDPLYEKVVCVHSEEDMECEECEPINEERKNNAYCLDTKKCLIKNKKE